MKRQPHSKRDVFQRMRWFQEGFKTGDVDRAVLLFDLNYSEL